MSKWRALVLAASVVALSCGNPGPKTMWNAPQPPRLLALDLMHVYLVSTDGRGTTLTRLSKEEQIPPKQLGSSNGEATAVAVDDDSLYLVVHESANGPDSIKRIPKKTGAVPANLLSTPNRVTSLALDATHVYWTQTGDVNQPDENKSSGVLRVMRTGGTPFNLAARQQGIPSQLALSATAVFWVRAAPDGSFAIMTVRKAGGEPATLATVSAAEAGSMPPVLAADDEAVYYVTTAGLMKIQAPSGRPIPLVRTSARPGTSFVIDSKRAYFQGPTGVMAASLQGGNAELLAPGVGTSLAVDEHALYWLSGTEVMQLPKH